MSDTEIFIMCIVIAIVFVFIIKGDSYEDESEHEQKRLKDNSTRKEEDEEMFYHPVTGYKGTRAEMDAYIYNREKRIKNE